MSREYKLQSAMEYLMTYGWAILIIAVVLSVLFQLGVFNSTNFAPRAPPGACRVLRTAGTTNLEGVCSGQLPQYVLMLPAGGYISIPVTTALKPSIVSLSAWVYEPIYSTSSNYPMIGLGETYWPWTQGYQMLMPTVGDTNPYYIIGNSVENLATIATFKVGRWQHVVGTFDGSNIRLYLNGVAGSSGSSTGITYAGVAGYVAFNPSDGNTMWFSNVQIYNTTLDANQIKALYLEGIGGAPVDPKHIIGWWPLNGDTSDYSGNNNYGTPSGASYISQWLSGYTPPG